MKLSKKKTVLIASGAAAALIAVFLLLFVFYPLLMKNEIERKFPDAGIKWSEDPFKGTAVPDDYEEVTVFGTKMSLPSGMNRMDMDAYSVVFLSGKGWGDSDVIIKCDNHVRGISDTDDWSCFDSLCKKLGKKVPGTNYELLKLCFGTTLDDFRLGSMKLAEDFRTFAEKKTEILGKLEYRDVYSFGTDSAEGIIMDISPAEDDAIFSLTVRAKGEYNNECIMSITADKETAARIISSIDTAE